MRLNFGCGPDIRDGWVNFDIVDHGQPDVGDLLDGLPYPDAVFDCVVANHSVSAIRFDDLNRALIELRRVLKPGGVLRVLVPSFLWSLTQWQQDRRLPVGDTVEPTKDGRFLRYLFWHGDSRSAFTADSLTDTLHRAGYQQTEVCGFRQTHSGIAGITDLDSREEESLIVEATK